MVHGIHMVYWLHSTISKYMNIKYHAYAFQTVTNPHNVFMNTLILVCLNKWTYSRCCLKLWALMNKECTHLPNYSCHETTRRRMTRQSCLQISKFSLNIFYCHKLFIEINFAKRIKEKSWQSRRWQFCPFWQLHSRRVVLPNGEPSLFQSWQSSSQKRCSSP